MAALTEVMKRQPPPKMNIICSDGIYKAINEAIMDQWEIVSQKRSKCPNCGETALNDHCPHCDYPYN